MSNLFGYIRVHKPELKFREFEEYQAVYCTLCRQLKTDYGFAARFLLDYDLTFLVMLRMNLAPVTEPCEKARCPYKCGKPCPKLPGHEEVFSYGAALTVLLANEKLKDDIADEKFARRLLARLIRIPVAHWSKIAAKRCPEAAKITADITNNQAVGERESEFCFDRCADDFAQSTAKLLSLALSAEPARLMQSIGYHVGRWVYLTDALDDYQKDAKRKRFNPFALRLPDASLDEVAAFAQKQLYICIDQACLAFDLLPGGRFTPVLRNILYCGLEARQNQIIRRITNHE